MICEVCGSEIPAGCSACPVCGTAAPQQPEPVVEQPQPVAQPQTAAQPQPQYQTNQLQSLPAAKRNNPFGLIGFVLSFFGITMVVGFVLSLIGVIKHKDYDSGNGLAIAGVILSGIYLVLIVIIIAVVVGAAASEFAFAAVL